MYSQFHNATGEIRNNSFEEHLMPIIIVRHTQSPQNPLNPMMTKLVEEIGANFKTMVNCASRLSQEVTVEGQYEYRARLDAGSPGTRDTICGLLCRRPHG